MFPMWRTGDFCGEGVYAGKQSSVDFVVATWSEIYYIEAAKLAELTHSLLDNPVVDMFVNILAMGREQKLRRRCWMARVLTTEFNQRNNKTALAAVTLIQYHLLRKRKRRENELVRHGEIRKLLPFFFEYDKIGQLAASQQEAQRQSTSVKASRRRSSQVASTGFISTLIKRTSQHFDGMTRLNASPRLEAAPGLEEPVEFVETNSTNELGTSDTASAKLPVSMEDGLFIRLPIVEEKGNGPMATGLQRVGGSEPPAMSPQSAGIFETSKLEIGDLHRSIFELREQMYRMQEAFSAQQLATREQMTRMELVIIQKLGGGSCATASLSHGNVSNGAASQTAAPASLASVDDGNIIRTSRVSPSLSLTSPLKSLLSPRQGKLGYGRPGHEIPRKSDEPLPNETNGSWL